MNRPFEEILQSYLDGELDPVEAARVRERIETDPDARARHAILVATREALESAVPEPVVLPPEVEARLRQTLEAEESPAETPRLSFAMYDGAGRPIIFREEE